MAHAVYALSHSASAVEVAAMIRSRDLSHKGNERRQNEYVERTIKKALATIERRRQWSEGIENNGLTDLHPVCEITERGVGLGWSKASCTKQYRKKSVITAQPARNRTNFFGPIKSNSKTKTHISEPPLDERL